MFFLYGPIIAVVSLSFQGPDGGLTFPTLLLGATANDGEERVVLPFVDAASARVKAVCSDNVFFDLSDGDLSVVSVATPKAVEEEVPVEEEAAEVEGEAPDAEPTAEGPETSGEQSGD